MPIKMPFVKARRYRELQRQLDAVKTKLREHKDKISACRAELKQTRHALKALQGESSGALGMAPVLEHMNAREILSYRYLRGNGLEIGALHYPTKTAPDARTKYYDYLTAEESRKRYQGWSDVEKNKLVEVDYVGDGEKLDLVEDGTLDYLIANHMLEHCQNVIATLRVFWSKLKQGGNLFLAIPDKRYTFDYMRQVTPFEHLERDAAEGPTVSLYEHYVEFRGNSSIGSKLQDLTKDEVLKLPHVDIHFHVWTQMEIIEMFLRLRRDHGFNWEIQAIMRQGNEVIVVLKKEDVEIWDRGDPATKPPTS